MSTDGVRKSASNIILAARFCNFRSRSSLKRMLSPKSLSHNLSKAECNFDRTISERVEAHTGKVGEGVIF